MTRTVSNVVDWTCDFWGCISCIPQQTAGELPTKWQEIISVVVMGQTVTIGDRTGGTYILSLNGQTTAPIAWDAGAVAVKAALELLSNVATVTVTQDTDWTINLDDCAWDEDGLTMDGTLLTGGTGGEGISINTTAHKSRQLGPVHKAVMS